MKNLFLNKKFQTLHNLRTGKGFFVLVLASSSFFILELNKKTSEASF